MWSLCVCPLQRPSLVTVVEWIDYETLALLFGMVRCSSHVYLLKEHRESNILLIRDPDIKFVCRERSMSLSWKVFCEGFKLNDNMYSLLTAMLSKHQTVICADYFWNIRVPYNLVTQWEMFVCVIGPFRWCWWPFFQRLASLIIVLWRWVSFPDLVEWTEKVWHCHHECVPLIVPCLHACLCAETCPQALALCKIRCPYKFWCLSYWTTNIVLFYLVENASYIPQKTCLCIFYKIISV